MGSRIAGSVLAGFFQKLADALMSGDYDWLLDVYVYPLVVYMQDEIFLERTHEETLSKVRARRERAMAACARSVRTTIEEVGPANAGRFPVRVDWAYLDADGQVIARSSLRYYCRFDEFGDTRIEILEIIEQAFPAPSERPRPRSH